MMFRPVQGWESYYEVNECGEVRNISTGKLLKGDLNSAGYPRVTLFNKNHVPPRQHLLRHRIVAAAFVDNPNCFDEVDHIDSNIKNYCADNLRWVDRNQNEFFSHTIGSKIYRPVLVETIDGITVYDFAWQLADEYCVSLNTARKWISGESNTFYDYGINDIRIYKEANNA